MGPSVSHHIKQSMVGRKKVSFRKKNSTYVHKSIVVYSYFFKMYGNLFVDKSTVQYHTVLFVFIRNYYYRTVRTSVFARIHNMYGTVRYQKYDNCFFSCTVLHVRSCMDITYVLNKNFFLSFFSCTGIF